MVAMVDLLLPNERFPDVESEDGINSNSVLRSLVKVGLAVALREAWGWIYKLLD